MPDELVAALNQVYFRFPSGLTIGPAVTPSAVEERQFESVLRLLLDEASTHGWLGGPETSGQIRSVLTQVARARAVGNEAEVRRLLGSLDSRFAEGEYGDVLIEGRSLLRILGALQ
jgi:hypothetical protein